MYQLRSMRSFQQQHLPAQELSRDGQGVGVDAASETAGAEYRRMQSLGLRLVQAFGLVAEFVFSLFITESPRQNPVEM